MRILTVGSLYPPHDEGGGAEIAWQSAVEALRGSGHDAGVLTTDHRRAGRDAGDEPGVWRELRWYWRDHAFPRRSFREVLAIERHNRDAVGRRLDVFAPDVVAWFPMGGMSLAPLELVRRRRVPAVAFVHDDWLLYGPVVDQWQARWRARPRAARLAERAFRVPTALDLEDAAHYAFASESTRARAARALPAPRSASVATPGITRTFLGAPAPVRKWGWKLLYVGRIDPRKGIATAVRATALLPEARLAIAGSGAPDEVAALEREVAAAGVENRVALLGQRGHDDLPAVYAGADAVVFPVEWEEPWGLVPLEAMGCGRPVIATGTGGSGEYLRDGENALLFEPGDAEALAACVRRLAGDEALRSRLRAGGLATAPLHSADRFHADVEALLEQATHP